MRIGMLISAVIWIGILSLCSCAGVEIGGKMGIYGVDDRHEVQDTTSRAKPLICMWKQCDNNGNIIQGS